MFDKRRLNESITKAGASKSTANDVYERLRREVASLAKLRHPALVKLIEPLEETKGTMRFVTEPLTSCLQHMIHVNSSSAGSSEIDGGELDEIVIQKGVLQLAEGLDFVHTAAGLVHLDIQPSSILINIKGDWKLFGLGFTENYKDGPTEYFIPRFDPRLPSYVQVNLDYAAPELILEHKLDVSNDIFSLGCLLIALFTFRPPMRTDNNPNVYKQEFSGITKILRDERIPKYLHDMIPQLVARYPNQRPTLEQFKNSPLFDNVLIRTINFLDDFPAKLPSEQQAFMTGFSKLIDQFPKSVLQRKILPTLLEELGKEETLVGSILVNIFEVGKDMSQLGFSEKILPGIRRVASVLSAKVAVLKYMNTLKSRVNGNEFRDDILPIVLDAMETAPPEIQEVALKQIPLVIEKLDFVTLKSEVFPKVGLVFANTTSLSVKLEALNAFEHLVKNGLDKYAVTEKLLPLLNGMKTREPKVMMGALNVYSKVIHIVDIEVLARVIVPQLLSMSMESMLNLNQFRAFIDEIKSLLDRIEKEHGKRLSQVQVESKPSTSKSPVNGENESSNFEDIIYGRKKSTASPVAASTPQSQTSPNPQATLPFGSLKLEPSAKPSFASFSSSQTGNRLESSISGSVNSMSALQPMNNLQALKPKQSMSYLQPSRPSIPTLQSSQQSVPTLQPSNSSGWQQPLQSSSIPTLAFNNMGTSSAAPSNSWDTLRSTTTNTSSTIDWSQANKPKAVESFGGSFGQTKISSPLASPTMNNNMGNWGAPLQPEQKYHINRSVSAQKLPNPPSSSKPNQTSLI